jgi:hypothetical protein
MGQSIEDIAKGRDAGLTADIATLDDRIAAILTDIESAAVPERLLELASALQSALVLRRQRRTPN